MKAIPFHKYHALGNDFVILNNLNNAIDIKKISIAALAHRHTGIGFDQLLLIEPGNQAEFACRFFNADGSEAEQCGNGVRCVARFLHEEKLCENSLSLQTKSRVVEIEIKNYDAITVNMGVPTLSAPVTLQIADQAFSLDIVSMGNPHALCYVSSIQDDALIEYGEMIATHPKFPQGTNVGFIEIIDKSHIHLRTYERGVGETYACGSNACAAVVAGIAQSKLDEKVEVKLELGSLLVGWEGNNTPVWMTGPTSKVFVGNF